MIRKKEKKSRPLVLYEIANIKSSILTRTGAVAHSISELSHRLLFLSHKNTICHKYCCIIAFIGSGTMGILYLMV